jgi:hypothetical protein
VTTLIKTKSKKTIVCDFCFHPSIGRITRGPLTRAKKHQLRIRGELDCMLFSLHLEPIFMGNDKVYYNL